MFECGCGFSCYTESTFRGHVRHCSSARRKRSNNSDLFDSVVDIGLGIGIAIGSLFGGSDDGGSSGSDSGFSGGGGDFSGGGADGGW